MSCRGLKQRLALEFYFYHLLSVPHITTMSSFVNEALSTWYNLRYQRAERNAAQAMETLLYLAEKTNRLVPPSVESQTTWEILQDALLRRVNIPVPVVVVYIVALVVTEQIFGFLYLYNAEIKAFFTQCKRANVIQLAHGIVAGYYATGYRTVLKYAFTAWATISPRIEKFASKSLAEIELAPVHFFRCCMYLSRTLHRKLTEIISIIVERYQQLRETGLKVLERYGLPRLPVKPSLEVPHATTEENIQVETSGKHKF